MPQLDLFVLEISRLVECVPSLIELDMTCTTLVHIVCVYEHEYRVGLDCPFGCFSGFGAFQFRIFEFFMFMIL